MGRRGEKLVMTSITEISENESLSDQSESDAFIQRQRRLEEPVSNLYLICLTCGLGGLQVVWSVILSNGSPYLVSLGLSKSFTALVWIAAPLCGTVIQPLVGRWSDHASTSWGKRRPFIGLGALGIAISMNFLAWSREILTPLLKTSDRMQLQPRIDVAVISFAIFWIYALNVAVQPVQAGIRALIVESVPFDQQSRANTYATIMQGLGNILGYLYGFGVLPALTASSLSSFQSLSLFSTTVLFITLAITCGKIREPSTKLDQTVGDVSVPQAGRLTQLVQTYSKMPRSVRKVCHVQFLSWMAWFPFLYYSTTYVAEFYTGKLQFLNGLKDHPPMSAGTSGVVETSFSMSQEAVRYGTFASFLFAIVTFLHSIILPKVLSKIPKSTFGTSSSSPKSRTMQAWMYSHICFALLMFSTFFVRSQAAATAVVAVTGLSWAVTLFAPFAIISTELAARRDVDDDESLDSTEQASAREESQTGAIMGLHNVAISLPQILSALMCSIIYATAKALHLTDGTSWVLRAGGLSALGAAWLCRTFDD